MISSRLRAMNSWSMRHLIRWDVIALAGTETCETAHIEQDGPSRHTIQRRWTRRVYAVSRPGHAVFTPSLAYDKGEWGPVDIQGTAGVSLPTSVTSTRGRTTSPMTRCRFTRAASCGQKSR